MQVQYRLIGNSGPNAHTITKNISAGGVKIILAEKLPLNSRLDIKFILPGDNDTVRVIGEIVWQQDTPHNQGYDTGIRYIEIDQHDIQRITNYVLHCVSRNLSETQNKISETKKMSEVFFKEIRLPGDKSPLIKAPSFLINEVNLPGDKVRYAKISSSIPMRYKIIGDNHHCIPARSLSQYIGSRGLWFLAESPVPTNTQVELTLELPDGQPPIQLKGQITDSKEEIRLNDAQQKIFYATNLKFTDISPNDRKRIIRYVYSCKAEFFMMGKHPPTDWLHE